MNNQTNKLIPELRFPEFVNQGAWNEDNVDNLFHLQDGYPFSSFDFTDSETNSKQVVRITDINNQNKSLEKVFIAEGKVENFEFQKYKVEKGNLLLSLTGVAGFNFFIWKDEDAFLNQRTMKISSKDDSNQAIIILLEPLIYEKINLMGTGQNNNLSKEALKDVKVAFPKPKEQQKIADCLCSLDEVITAHTDKLETLKNYKKGLMQNLFPQKDQKVPKFRFKEFEKDGDWMENALEKISHKIMVGIASAATHAYRESGIILFRNQNIKEGFLDDKDVIFIDEEYEKEHINKRLKAGDLLTARTGYPGTTCVVPQKYEGSQSFTTLIIRPNNKFVDSIFLCFYINSETGQAFFNSTKIGGGQQNVNAGSLSEMPIPFPKKKEQQKIVETLSSLDDLIKEQANKIEQLKLHKKGLMQGLFPKVKNNR